MDGISNASRRALSSEWTARCIVGAKNWWIEAAVANTVRTYFFDGTTVLQTTKITRKAEIPEAVKKKLPPGVVRGLGHEPTQSDWIFLTISPGEVPLESLEVQLPWLAFCSGAYLRRPGRLVPLLSAVTRCSPGAFGFRDRTETFYDELELPRAVDLLASGELFAKSLKHESLNRVGRPAAQIRAAVSPHPYLPEGFVKARYRVLAVTNAGGWSIPTSFSYEEFKPVPDGPSLQILFATGLVSSIEPSPPPTFALCPTARYSVADYRFRHPTKTVDQIQYAITNGQVPSTSEPILRQLFQKHLATASFDPVMQVHFGIYVVFAALVAGPVIAVAVARLRRKRRTNGG